MYYYKAVFGLVSVNFHNFFEFSTTTKTRDHANKSQTNSSVRWSFCVQRVISTWNSLYHRHSINKFWVIVIFQAGISLVAIFNLFLFQFSMRRFRLRLFTGAVSVLVSIAIALIGESSGGSIEHI